MTTFLCQSAHSFSSTCREIFSLFWIPAIASKRIPETVFKMEKMSLTCFVIKLRPLTGSVLQKFQKHPLHNHHHYKLQTHQFIFVVSGSHSATCISVPQYYTDERVVQSLPWLANGNRAIEHHRRHPS